MRYHRHRWARSVLRLVWECRCGAVVTDKQLHAVAPSGRRIPITPRIARQIRDGQRTVTQVLGSLGVR